MKKEKENIIIQDAENIKSCFNWMLDVEELKISFSDSSLFDLVIPVEQAFIQSFSKINNELYYIVKVNIAPHIKNIDMCYNITKKIKNKEKPEIILSLSLVNKNAAKRPIIRTIKFLNSDVDIVLESTDKYRSYMQIKTLI